MLSTLTPQQLPAIKHVKFVLGGEEARVCGGAIGLGVVGGLCGPFTIWMKRAQGKH